MSTVKNKPSLLIQASAIGYYGNRNVEDCSEMCKEGKGFLAEVCTKWESTVPKFEEMLERVITVRIGVVLGKDGGMLPEMLKQSKRHLAGTIGSGEQWMSWIHIYDLVYAILYLMNDEKVRGIYNLVAPEPIRQKDFVQMLKDYSGRRMQFPVPSFLVRMLLGDFGREMLLSGQKVVAGKLLRQGFLYKYPTAGQALENIRDPFQA